MISNQKCIPHNEDSVPSYQIQIQIAQVKDQKHKGKQKEHSSDIQNISNIQQDFKDGKIKEQLLEISEYLHDPSSFGPWIPQEGSYNEQPEKSSFQPRGSRRIYSSKVKQKRTQSNRNPQDKLELTSQNFTKTNKTTIKDDQTKLNSTYEEDCKISNNFSQQEPFLSVQYAQSAQLSNRQSIFLEQTLEEEEEEQPGSSYECPPQNSNIKPLLKPNPRRVSSTPQQIMQSHDGDKNCCYNMPLRCTLPRFLKGKGQKIKSEYNQYIKVNQGVQQIPSSEEERLRHVKEFKNIAKRKPRLSLINQVIDSILLDADSNQNIKQENMSSEGFGVHNSHNNPSGSSSSFEFKYKPPHSATLALSKNIQSIKAFISSKGTNGSSCLSQVVKPSEIAQSFKNNHLNEEKHQSNGFKSACVMVLNPLAIPIPQEDFFLLSKEALESSYEKRSGSSFAGSRSKSLVDTFPQNFSLERISQKNTNEKDGQTPQWGYQDFNFVVAQKDGQTGLNKQNSVDYSFSRAESAGGRMTLQDKQFAQKHEDNLGGPLKSRLVTPNNTNLHSQTSSQLQQHNQIHHLQSKGYENQFSRQGIQEYNIQWNKKSVSKYQSQITNFMSNLDAQLSTKENRSKSPVLSKEYSKKKPQYLRQSIQLQSQQDKSKPQIQGSSSKMAGIQRINEQNNQLISVNCRRIL